MHFHHNWCKTGILKKIVFLTLVPKNSIPAQYWFQRFNCWIRRFPTRSPKLPTLPSATTRTHLTLPRFQNPNFTTSLRIRWTCQQLSRISDTHQESRRSKEKAEPLNFLACHHRNSVIFFLIFRNYFLVRLSEYCGKSNTGNGYAGVLLCLGLWAAEVVGLRTAERLHGEGGILFLVEERLMEGESLKCWNRCILGFLLRKTAFSRNNSIWSCSGSGIKK